MEFEYEIPLDDAMQLLTLSQTPVVEKYRYRIPFEGHLWEVDEFCGDNSGLVVAEVELKSEGRNPTSNPHGLARRSPPTNVIATPIWPNTPIRSGRNRRPNFLL